MVASGPMALTALCLFQAGAQMEAAARVETRVGEISGSTSVMALATPSLRVDWFSGADSLAADLSTRILWRPVPLPRTRPLFLETFGLIHNARPTLRSQWHFDIHASYGEQDYTSLSQQFATQPTLPLAATMFMISGAADALWRASRLTTLGIHMGATHRRSIDDQGSGDPSVGVSTLPTQTMISGGPEMRVALSRRSTLEISVPVSIYDIQENTGDALAPKGSTNVFSLQPQIHLIEMLNRNHRLRLAAGLTYAGSAGGGAATDLGHLVTPLALIGLDSDLYRSHSASVRSSVSFETTWFVDPVLGRGIWRGIGNAGVDALVGLRWSAGLRFSSTIDMTKPPAAYAETDGTLVSAESSVRYRWTDVVVVELGSRYTERGPYLGTSNFAWRGREVWGFLTLYTWSRVRLTSVRPIQSITGSGM
jgi:hypothetical protein